MISKVTKSNKELIKQRIKEINEALQTAGSTTVLDETLESYYANIVEIAKLSTDFHNAPYKYLLMPLDEPLFEIDADKRVISVPANFNKNGVGVYGDHMAEVLYFSIDRYFDYQDLFNVDEIIINWQFRKSGSSRNASANSEINTSIALAPDDSFIPGKVVFGWVITDEMTPSKGTLTFSVSFLKRTGSQYEYVLNTQSASVNINDSLVLEDPSVLDSMSRPVFERLMDSRYTPETMTPLADPSFRLALPSVAQIENEDLLLQAIGYTNDEGNIKYTWSGSTFADPILGISSQEINRAGDSASLIEDYIPTVSESPEEDVSYFVKVGQVMMKLPCDYNDDDIDESVEDAFNDEDLYDSDGKPQIYELGSSFIYTDSDEAQKRITKPGTYTVSIQSEKEVPHAQGVKAKSGNTSSSCVIPMPAVPSIKLNVASVEPGDGEYTIVSEEEAQGFTFVDDDAPAVDALISIDENKKDNSRGITDDSQLGLIGLFVANQNSPGYNSGPSLAEILELQNSESNPFRPLPANKTLSVVNSDEMSAEDSYHVFAINYYNNTYQVSDPSDELKISKIAPFLSQVNVVGHYNNEDIELITNNKPVKKNNELSEDDSVNTISMIADHGYNCAINVSVSDNLNGAIIDNIQIIEVDNETDEPLESGNDEPNIYDFDQRASDPSRGEFVFNINDDSGRFKVYITTRYHGTQRKTKTDSFSITWDR